MERAEQCASKHPPPPFGKPKISYRNAANRLQLRIWPLCVPAQSLREFMSSIMRWRSGSTSTNNRGGDRR